MARAHRIGQRREVSIFRLVTRATYESEMFLRASRKLGLDHALLTNLEVGRGALDDSEKDDINKLLKLGAYGLFDDDDTQANKFVESNIDDILKTRTNVVTITKARNEDEEDEEGGEGGQKKPKSKKSEQAASTIALQTARMNVNKMQFEATGSSSTLDVNDPLFWNKLLPVDDSERFSPDQLLSQITDGSASESEAARAEFYRYLTLTTERCLKQKRDGDDGLNMDSLVNLLIQFAAAPAFTIAQREKAQAWLSEAEKRLERKARAGRLPVGSLNIVKGRSTQGRQRGQMSTAGMDRDSYHDDGPPARRGKKRTGGTKFGRITNIDDSSEDGDSGGSDFGGGYSDRSDGEDDGEEAEADADEKLIRRQSKARQARSLKRRKGLLNLDICEVCHQSGKLLACDGMCQGWYHLECGGLTQPPPDDVEWQCKKCVEKRHPCHVRTQDTNAHTHTHTNAHKRVGVVRTCCACDSNAAISPSHPSFPPPCFVCVVFPPPGVSRGGRRL